MQNRWILQNPLRDSRFLWEVITHPLARSLSHLLVAAYYFISTYSIDFVFPPACAPASVDRGVSPVNRRISYCPIALRLATFAPAYFLTYSPSYLLAIAHPLVVARSPTSERSPSHSDVSAYPFTILPTSVDRGASLVIRRLPMSKVQVIVMDYTTLCRQCI